MTEEEAMELFKGLFDHTCTEGGTVRLLSMERQVDGVEETIFVIATVIERDDGAVLFPVAQLVPPEERDLMNIPSVEESTLQLQTSEVIH